MQEKKPDKAPLAPPEEVSCPSCGALFPADRPNCPYCGTMYLPAAEAAYMDGAIPKEAMAYYWQAEGAAIEKMIRMRNEP